MLTVSLAILESSGGKNGAFMDLTLTPSEVGQAQFNNGSITDLHTKNCHGCVLV